MRKLSIIALAGILFPFSATAQDEGGFSIEEMFQRVNQVASSSTATSTGRTNKDEVKDLKIAPLSDKVRAIAAAVNAHGNKRIKKHRNLGESWAITELLCDLNVHKNALKYARSMIKTRQGLPSWSDKNRDKGGEFELLAARVLSGMKEWRSADVQYKKHLSKFEEGTKIKLVGSNRRRPKLEAGLDSGYIEYILKVQIFVKNLEEQHATLDELEAEYANNPSADTLYDIVELCKQSSLKVDNRLRWLTASATYLEEYPSERAADSATYHLADAYSYFHLYKEALSLSEEMLKKYPDSHNVTRGNVSWNIVMYKIYYAKELGGNNKKMEAIKLLLEAENAVRPTAREYPDHWRSKNGGRKVRDEIRRVKREL